MNHRIGCTENRSAGQAGRLRYNPCRRRFGGSGSPLDAGRTATVSQAARLLHAKQVQLKSIALNGSSVLLALLLVSCQSVDWKSAAQHPTFIEGEDPCPAGMKWVQVKGMSDEFSGRRVDLKKWQVDPVGNSFTWEGRPPGLFLADNVSVADGDRNLRLESDSGRRRPGGLRHGRGTHNKV